MHTHTLIYIYIFLINEDGFFCISYCNAENITLKMIFCFYALQYENEIFFLDYSNVNLCLILSHAKKIFKNVGLKLFI